MTRTKRLFRILGIKKRDRVRAALRDIRRNGRVLFAAAPFCIELLVLCRGMKNAVERNKARRRIREAVRVLAAADPGLLGRIFVVTASPRDSKMRWDELCLEVKKRLR